MKTPAPEAGLTFPAPDDSGFPYVLFFCVFGSLLAHAGDIFPVPGRVSAAGHDSAAGAPRQPAYAVLAGKYRPPALDRSGGPGARGQRQPCRAARAGRCALSPLLRHPPGPPRSACRPKPPRRTLSAGQGPARARRYPLKPPPRAPATIQAATSVAFSGPLAHASSGEKPAAGLPSPRERSRGADDAARRGE